MKTEITFLKVINNITKASCIQATVQRHFEMGQSVLLIVPNDEAARYIDLLLWRFPEDSFLPHCISQNSTNDSVVITTKPQNINGASVLFNLCSNVSPIFADFATLYELLDETDPVKLQLSQKRRETYENEGYFVHVSLG